MSASSRLRIRRPRRTTIVLLALVQAVVLAASSWAAVERWVGLPLDDDMYVVLVMGSDQGPPRSGSVLEGRADGIHLVVVDEQQEHVSILSFPRDSYVPVRGIGTTKINAMLTRGAENAVGTMEDLTGIQIDDWIVTGFDAMIVGVDEFGGIHHDVEQRLNNAKANTNMDPGVQRLTGWGALGYSRDRGSRPNGDIGRSTGQGRLLASMHAELVDDVSSPTQLMDVAGILRRHTVSSISTDRLVRLGLVAMRIPTVNVGQVTMPGNVGTAGAASVYRLNDAAYGIIGYVRENGRLSVFDGEG